MKYSNLGKGQFSSMKTCIFVTMNFNSQHISKIFSAKLLGVFCMAMMLMAFFPDILHSQGGTPISGIINNYARVIQYHSCSKTVDVVGTNGFVPNSKVLMIQMDGAIIDTTNTPSFGTVLNYGNAGNAEVLEIESIIGSSIVFKHAPLLQYDPEKYAVQLVTIPVYDTVLISVMTLPLTCSPWNGSTGGVLAFEVRLALDIAGTIDVSGTGFEGGRVRNNGNILRNILDYALPMSRSDMAGEKGRGIALLKEGYLLGRGAPANAGGGGNAHNAGGGGGANGGEGGIGGNDYQKGNNKNGGLPGKPIPHQHFINDSLPRIFMGGGGGAGQVNGNVSLPGGNGGGIVFIRANNVILRQGAKVISNGANVGGPKLSGTDGYGGGGAGGSIYFDVNRFIPFGNDFQINAIGGKGGISAEEHGPGGGGGGGVVMFKDVIPSSAIINVAGGKPGNWSGTSNSFGAEAGKDGLVIGNIRYIESNKVVMALSASKDTSVCEKSPIQLSVKPLGGKPPYTYQWTGTNITDPSAQTTTARPITNENYRVIVTDADGCTNFAIVKVTVLPAPSLNLPVNRITACKGDTIILRANSMQEITWLPSTGLLENKGNQVRCIVDSARTYTVFAETPSGCSAIDTIRIEVQEAPTITAMERISEICPEDDSISIPRSLVFGAMTPYIARWFTANDTLVVDSTFKQLKVKPQQTTMYYIEFTTPIGCIYRDSVLIIVNQKPNITLTKDTIICKGNSLSLNASGGVNYEWTPNTSLSDPNSANPIANPIVNTTYFVKVTSAKGCIAVDSIIVTVIDPPQKPILTRSNDTVFVKGDGSQYEWLFNGNMISKAQDSLLIIDSAGYYSVLAKNAYCSTLSDSIYVSIGNARIVLDSITLNNNESAIVHIRALDTNGIQESGITGITLSLSWNATVAEITNPSFTQVSGIDLKSAVLTLPLNTSPIIGSLNIRGLLGNAPETSITIDGVKAIGGLMRTNTVNGNVKIGDICYEGGIRLWHADKTVSRARITINPHPIESSSEIILDIPEQGRFTLQAFTQIGTSIPIASGFTLPGKVIARLPFEALSSGMYTLMLQTPTESISLPIIINK